MSQLDPQLPINPYASIRRPAATRVKQGDLFPLASVVNELAAIAKCLEDLDRFSG